MTLPNLFKFHPTVSLPHSLNSLFCCFSNLGIVSLLEFIVDIDKIKALEMMNWYWALYCMVDVIVCAWKCPFFGIKPSPKSFFWQTTRDPVYGLLIGDQRKWTTIRLFINGPFFTSVISIWKFSLWDFLKLFYVSKDRSILRSVDWSTGRSPHLTFLTKRSEEQELLKFSKRALTDCHFIDGLSMVPSSESTVLLYHLSEVSKKKFCFFVCVVWL